MAVIVRGLNNLNFVPLDQVAVERLLVLEMWIRLCVGGGGVLIDATDLFEEEKKGYNILWNPSPSATETELGLLIYVRL